MIEFQDQPADPLEYLPPGIAKNVHKKGGPFDRLTQLSAEMTEVLNRKGNEKVKAIVMLNEGKRAGIQLHGYESDVDAMADIFVHLQAIFQANGKELSFVGIPDSPEGAE